MNLRILLVLLLTGLATLLSANAATASVTALTSPEEETYVGNITAEAEGGHVVLHNPTATIECGSKLESAVEVNGEEEKAGGAIKSLSFTSCTSSWDVTTVTGGSLWVEQTGGGNGKVFSNGATIQAVSTILGITCRYKTSETQIGTLTGSATSESKATLDLSASIPFHSGSVFCGTSATALTGSYLVTAPAPLAAAPVLEYFAFPASDLIYEGAVEAGQSSKWKIEGLESSCTEVKFVSPLTKSKVSALKLAPEFAKCTNFGYKTSSSTNTGCRFELQQPVKGTGVTAESNAAIRCDAGKAITLRGEEGKDVCQVAIGEVAGNVKLKKMKYQDLGGTPQKYEVIFGLEKITVAKEIDEGNCPLNGVGNIATVTYEAQASLGDKAKARNIFIS